MATGTTLITLNDREPPGEGMLANYVANRSVDRGGAVAHENVAANNKFILPTDHHHPCPPSLSTTLIFKLKWDDFQGPGRCDFEKHALANRM